MNHDASGRSEVDVVERGLAVRHCQRDAILNESHAAHAERSARAQSADGDACTEREVVAIVDHQAGHVGQGFIECYAQPAGLNSFATHERERRREARELGAARHRNGESVDFDDAGCILSEGRVGRGESDESDMSDCGSNV